MNRLEFWQELCRVLTEFVRSDERDFWMAVRQALLMIVDAIERKLEVVPRTSALRKSEKKPYN